MPNKSINIGLVGAGEFGNFASFVIEMLKGYRLYAVVDTNESAALNLAKKYNAKIYADYKELLKDKAVDLIVINVPNDLHAKITCDALKAGKKVLCEKPLGINLAEIKKVEKTLKETKGILLVNYLLPRSEIYQKLAKIVEKNRYGKLKFAYIENLATESTIPNAWYWDEKRSGGWFLTADIHFYDLICHIFGNKIDLRSAKEYKKGTRTSAIYTSLGQSDGVIDIFHNFDSGYKRVGFKARFVFERSDIEIIGWIPTGMIIQDANGRKITKIKENRELVYRRLVGENILDLTKISHQDSLNNLKRVIISSKIAFEAQKTAKREEK